MVTALHVERLDLSRETTEQNGLVDGVCHQPLWSLGDVLRVRHTTDRSKQRSFTQLSQEKSTFMRISFV